MDREKFLYYSGSDLILPVSPKKPKISDNMSKDEYFYIIDEYRMLYSKYKQKLNNYKDEKRKREIEFIRHLSNEHQIDYDTGKKIFNHCIINTNRNDILSICNEFSQIVKIHKILNCK